MKTDIPHDILRIKADLTQMQMVMSAIISNASEAIDSTGCIRITGRNIEINEENSKEFGIKILNVNLPIKIGWNLIGWYKNNDTTASSIAENITGCFLRFA